jgi:uncharacterized protein GlcG (DUF336 family)
MGAGGRALAQRTSAAPAFFTALTDISAGRIVPVAGGLLIRDSDGHVIGAMGVSGDHPEKDDVCAAAGIARAGLKADVG